jgi:hypothetical protein
MDPQHSILQLVIRILRLNGGEDPSIDIQDSQDVIVADNVDASGRPFLRTSRSRRIGVVRNNLLPPYSGRAVVAMLAIAFVAYVVFRFV